MSVVAIVGAGHVGLVYAAGLSSAGHRVRVVDLDRSKVRRLRSGEPWFTEPGLDRLLRRGLAAGRIIATTSYRIALAGAEFVLVCVPTPSRPDGTLDDRAVRAAFRSVRDAAPSLRPVVVNKSTVPVGTVDSLALLRRAGFEVVSAPEFLAQGSALRDFFHPDRIVLGADSSATAQRVARLFRRTRAPIAITDSASAEFSKLAANAFLAMKVSFANTIAQLASGLGVDAAEVLRIVGLDRRIGSAHLRPGIGFGGSCLPKDTAALRELSRAHGVRADLFAAVLKVNDDATEHVVRLLRKHGGGVRGRVIAVLGLAYKAGTDDTRDSRAVALARRLVALGARVHVYDPVARLPGRPGHSIRQFATAMTATSGAAITVIATEWPEFGHLDGFALRASMRGDLVLDARGIVDAEALRGAGLRLIVAAATADVRWSSAAPDGRVARQASSTRARGTRSSPRGARVAPRQQGRRPR
jgi:UDPglucose 6-dehydrogenase